MIKRCNYSNEKIKRNLDGNLLFFNGEDIKIREEMFYLMISE